MWILVRGSKPSSVQGMEGPRPWHFHLVEREDWGLKDATWRGAQLCLEAQLPKLGLAPGGH